MTETAIWFTQDIFIKLFQAGMVVDGRAGGLIIGKPNDGIMAIQETNDNRYYVAAMIEGGEYLLNHVASSLHSERISEINQPQPKTPKTLNININPKTRIINAAAEPHDKIILLDKNGQFIVNGNSTALHLDELEGINAANNPYSICDLSIMVPKNKIKKNHITIR